MPRIPISDVGSVGVIQDLPPHVLPPEAWSSAQNIRFQDNKVMKFTGHSPVFDPPSVAPYWAMAVPIQSEVFWLYMGLQKGYTVQQDGTHSNITRAAGDYTGTATDKWNGGVLGGIPVITNGVNDPQSWSPVSNAQLLIDLPNWPANTSCRVIRPFKNFLVAFNITLSSVVSPYKIKWSHPADPGSVPSSWDHTDATKDAGERELSDSQAGIIQDALLLRDVMVIYKDNSITGMQYIGGRFIFRTFPMFTGTGILTQRCVAALPNNEQHLVMTGDDLVIHDGQRMKSVVDRRWRKFLNNNMNPSKLNSSFIVGNQVLHEMWFCFASTDSTLPDRALTWNIEDGTIGVRDLTEAVYIAKGFIDESGADVSWNGDSASWDSDATQWGSQPFFPQSLGLLQLDPTNTRLFKMDDTNQFDSVDMESFVEREGLALVGVDRNGKPRVDVAKRKLLKRIWVRAEGGPFEVRVGSQEEIGGVTTMEAAQTFTPGTDQYLDFTTAGKLLTVRFQSSNDVAWEVHGYDMDIEVLGEI